MTSFKVMPSVALLLHSCFSLFSFQGAVPTEVGCGGDNRDRTDDPLLAKQVLSQLSYTPRFAFFSSVATHDALLFQKKFIPQRNVGFHFVKLRHFVSTIIFLGKAVRQPNDEPQKLNNDQYL